MADESVYMDVPTVEGFATKFKKCAEDSQAIAKGLEVAIAALNVVNLFGFGVATHAIKILNDFKTELQKMGRKMERLGEDVTSAKNAFVNGDETGSHHFM